LEPTILEFDDRHNAGQRRLLRCAAAVLTCKVQCIVAFVTVAWKFSVQKRNGNASVAPVTEVRPGKSARLQGVDWRKKQRTLVLGLAQDCHFCAESMFLYKNLAGYSNQRGSALQLVAVLPQSPEDSRVYLPKNGVTVNQIVHEKSPRSLGIVATPTLFLVDNQGIVTDVWVGKLQPSGEHNLWARLHGEEPPDGYIEKQIGRFITLSQYQQILASGELVTLLDVRQREPFASGHRNAATNIPSDELEVRATSEHSQQSWIVIDCEDIHPTHCDVSAMELKTLGFSRVAIMGEGAKSQ
jgi:rhodanese-related sulfurtransferase